MAHMTQRKCKNRRCGVMFMARTADVNRGWAIYCSKSCKANVQEKRTGQFRAYEAGHLSGNNFLGSEIAIRPDRDK